MGIQEIETKIALHYHKHAFATNYDVNIYRGCGHKCIYCFAQYSHKYLDSEQFFDDILVKTNVAESLDRDFSKRNWGGFPVNLCGVTDPYQTIEGKYTLMPKIIEVFMKHKNPLVITTKSALILRDIDLLVELNKVAHVDIRISISAMDENVRKKIEPFAAPTIDRLYAISEFSKRGIDTGILMMPIIPYLTDNIENLDEIFKIAKNNDAKSIIPQILHLRGNTKKVFFNHITEFFPELFQKINVIYKGSYADKDYLDSFRIKISSLRNKYNFYNKIPSYCNCKKQPTQLSLI